MLGDLRALEPNRVRWRLVLVGSEFARNVGDDNAKCGRCEQVRHIGSGDKVAIQFVFRCDDVAKRVEGRQCRRIANVAIVEIAVEAVV